MESILISAVIIIIFYFVFIQGGGLIKKNPDQGEGDLLFNEYRLFFAKECEKYGDEFLNSHDFKMIVHTIREGNFHLLDYQDASELSYSEETTELSYSSEEIAECLKGYMQLEFDASTGDNYEEQDLTKEKIESLFLALSYLYKPKEEYKLKLKDNYVIKEFAKCCVKSAKDGGDIKDVSKLPFPSEVILESLMREWKIAENQKEKDILESAGFDLAFYQEGVGLENLHMVGMDTDKYMKETGMDKVKDMKEFEKIPKEEREGKGMLFAKKLDSDEVKEHRKKWEHFNKLCEKDTIIIQGFIVGKITKTHVGDTPIDDLIKDLPDDDKDSD
jgi:hypothetical protein